MKNLILIAVGVGGLFLVWRWTKRQSGGTGGFQLPDLSIKLPGFLGGDKQETGQQPPSPQSGVAPKPTPEQFADLQSTGGKQVKSTYLPNSDQLKQLGLGGKTVATNTPTSGHAITTGISGR